MRKYNQGAFVRVVVSAPEVSRFIARWPGSQLPYRRVSFTFDRAGDLIDHSSDADCPSLVGLAAKAQRYARLD